MEAREIYKVVSEITKIGIMGKKKEKQLVTQYLEGISSKALEDYQHILKDYAGKRHGIYALYKKKKLYYVGLASSLKGRLKSHLRDRHAKKWDSFSIFLTLDNSYIKELETLVLHIVSPKGNTQRGRFIKGENLNRRFKRDVLNDMKSHLDFVVGKTINKKKSKKRIKSDGPILGQYGIASIKIRGFCRGKKYCGYVLKNGEVRFQNKRYNSPSEAGRAARGTGTNGWFFWYYLRSPGDWVKIDNLRK
ncbi:GIY-YIG nuclease family protein [Bacteriovoracaceae bacterium]|nr:GIY-YIG nuclease family protein [Bacteriovoracaceae bacterium]